MAGINCCYRRLLLNNSRLINKTGVLLQLTRKRHHLIFQMSSLQYKVGLQKPKLVFNTNKLLLYRLASTNITNLNEPVPDLKFKITEVKNESDHLKKQSTELNNETSNINKEPEIVESSNVNIIDESSLPPIPTPPSDIPEVEFISMGFSEPPIQSLGLGSWWPPGIIQNLLEFLHINLDLPWWESILIITFIIRLCMFPVFVQNVINSTNMFNNMPKMTEIQTKITNAKLRGDYEALMLHSQEFMKFMEEKKINIFSMFKVLLIQTPVFISMYSALSGMAKAPVESFKTGGLFWFQDFTQPDPNYILPVILAGTLYAVIETGSEGTPPHLRSPMVKWFMRGLPAVVFLFSLKFVACITWYWTVSNSISLLQALIFRMPAVKRVLKIPDKKYEAVQYKKTSKKGIINELKEGMENAKLMSMVQNRERMNQEVFQKSGREPVPRTFKRNPLLENNKKQS